MIISAIVACAENRIIGKDNDLPWRLPGDLRWFKEKTLNHHVIMGRKSIESLPKALPKRVNIVVTRDQHYFRSDCIIRHSIEEALAFAHKEGEKEAFILGGGNIYEQTKNIWNRLYLTEVHATPEGDTLFPMVDFHEYDLVFEEYHNKDDKNEYSYTFKIYERGII